MGTNYYALLPEHDNHWEGIHLTKTSAGWRPALHWHGGDYYRGWDDFVKFVMDPDTTIKDEYGRTWSKRLFIEKIERWNEDGRTHGNPGYDEYVRMDGFEFQGGDWS